MITVGVMLALESSLKDNKKDQCAICDKKLIRGKKHNK
jgi:hypothetical protein